MSNDERLKGFIEFCKFAGILKHTKRTGWVERVGIKDGESVADHSYRVALMAMVLADERNLDTEKLMRMALLHDLAESVIGDWDALKTKLEGREAEKRQSENKAIERILALLPEGLRSSYMKIWYEMEESKTRESVLFKQVDRLELLLQATEYMSEGHERNKFEAFNGAKKDVTDDDLKEIVRILDEETG